MILEKIVFFWIGVLYGANIMPVLKTYRNCGAKVSV